LTLVRRDLARARVAALIGAGLTLGVGACARAYVGVPLDPNVTPANIYALAVRARGGDRYAQLELGKMYEEGRGLPRDCRRAMRLYRLASEGSGGSWVYSPKVNGAPSSLIGPVGEKARGLQEARVRLARLKRSSNCGNPAR